MKAGLFLLALGAVSTDALSKSGKSSSGSRSGSSKSGKAAALLRKNIAVGAAIATIDEAFDFEEEFDEDDRNFWDLDLEMEDMDMGYHGYKKNRNNSRSISRKNARNCVNRCDKRRRGRSNPSGDYCVPDCGRAVCAARRGRSGRNVNDCIRDVSSRSRRGDRSYYDDCNGPNIRRSNNGRQNCKLNAKGKRKIQREQKRRGRNGRRFDDDSTSYEDEEDEDQDFAQDTKSAKKALPLSKEERKAAHYERKSEKKERKAARKAEKKDAKSSKDPASTAATEAPPVEIA